MSSSGSGGPPSATLAPALNADDIRELLDQPNRIALVAQPIVDLHRAAVVGFEMLARFTVTSGKPAFPDKVFAAAGALGLGPELEATVVARALEHVGKTPSGCFVAINIDPHHIEEPRVRDVIAAHGDLTGVIFELTEHRAIADLRAARRAVDGLRARGAMIAIDDAGAGYSGLKQIMELQPQILKVDRDLVTDVHTNEAKRTLIHMLGDLATRLDAWILAEGIETHSELHALLQLGVPLGQGYFLARPAPPWADLAEEPAAALTSSGRRRKVRGSGGSVGEGMEPATICRGDDAWAEAARLSLRVDKTGRPVEMRLVVDDAVHVRMENDLLRVNVETSIAAAAMRSLTRREHLRWDPLVCIDDSGQLMGVLPMPRIVGALANRVLATGESEPEPGDIPAAPLPRRH